MSIRAVTEDEWRLFPIHKDYSIVLLTEELEYYADFGDVVLGVVLLDKLDDDFSYVVLMKDAQRGHYCAVDMGVSAPTLDAARRCLRQKMTKRRCNGSR